MPISWLDHKPHAIAVYASWPALPSAHATLATGRPATALPGPVLHRLDCTSFCWRLRKFRLAGNILHGVVSCPALQRRVIRGWSPRRLRHLQFLPTQRRDQRIPSCRKNSFNRRSAPHLDLGYAPVSTREQDLTGQVAELLKHDGYRLIVRHEGEAVR